MALLKTPHLIPLPFFKGRGGIIRNYESDIAHGLTPWMFSRIRYSPLFAQR